MHTYGRATYKGVAQPGFLPPNSTDPPGTPAPLPLGVDDRPPSTVITRVREVGDGRIEVRGATADDGRVRRVLVNGKEARALAPDFLEWEAVLDLAAVGRPDTVTAYAEDAAGHVEARRHVVRLR